MIFTSTEVDVKKCLTINSIFIFSLGKIATLQDMSLRILKPVISIQSTDSNTENSITSFHVICAWKRETFVVNTLRSLNQVSETIYTSTG